MFGRTKIKLLVSNYINTDNVCRVYDKGNGAYIHAYASTTPRYLKKDGTFHNPEYRTCNGDPVTWTAHIGDTKNLKFKNIGDTL